ncbi:transglycosylase domain-containing protein [Salininema proteolyticum]|uniref:Transglycosylase domain-containing protein n=1 Tax=Salininema proteolyticum TaxID=1607685 RepID=A0ABV8TWR9_9ACTN
MQKLTRDLRPMRAMLKLLAGSVLAGVLTAALALPFIAGPGFLFEKGLNFYDAIPAELTDSQPPQTTQVYAADGETLITSFFQENRREIPLEDMGDVFPDAVLAAEDSKFYDHKGVDFPGLFRAALRTTSGDTQGASTITMQYVRNSLLYNAATVPEIIEASQRTPERKLREIKYSLQLEKEMSKKDILEGYLNVVYLGNHSYGVYAASYTYFNRPPSELTVHQAALLAALPKYPSYADGLIYGDMTNEPLITERRNWIIDRMESLGMVTEAEAAEHKEQGLDLDPRLPRSECTDAEPNDWGFFCDYFKEWWSQQEAFGDTPAQRLDLLKRGGLSVVTSLDPDAQEKAMKAVRERSDNDQVEALGSVSLEPSTGQVQVMAINRTYALDQADNGPRSDGTERVSNYPNTTLPLMSGNKAASGYPAGSTFKMFTMLAALEEGWPLKTTLPSPDKYKSQYLTAADDPAACGSEVEPNTKAWCTTNANAGVNDWQKGNFNMWKAFGRSSNTVFVQLQELVGTSKAVEMAERLGVEFRAPKGGVNMAREDGRLDNYGVFTLGFDSVPPLDMAEAFGTVANEGVHCEPTPVKAVYGADGAEWKDVAKPDCERRIDKEVADAAVSAGGCVVGYDGPKSKCDDGTFAGASVGEPMFGKTGTADFDRSYWFVGSTKSSATAAFAGDPDSYGNDDVAAGSWHDKVKETAIATLKASTSGEGGKWDAPTSKMINGEGLKKIPEIKCMDPQKALKKVEAAGFDARLAPGQQKSKCPKGKAFDTSVKGSAPAGSPVYILVSDGSGKKKSDDREPTPPPGDGDDGGSSDGPGNGGGREGRIPGNPDPGR